MRKRLKGKGKQQQSLGGFIRISNAAADERAAKTRRLENEHAQQRAQRAVSSAFGKGLTPLAKALAAEHVACRDEIKPHQRDTPREAHFWYIHV